MASMMEQEKRKDDSSYASNKRKQIQYPCGCKYLFDHDITLEQICHGHEMELNALYG
jgi:hypothetical protein